MNQKDQKTSYKGNKLKQNKNKKQTTHAQKNYETHKRNAQQLKLKSS